MNIKKTLALTLSLLTLIPMITGCTGTSTKMDDTKISDSFSEAFGGFDLKFPTTSPEKIPAQTPTQTQESEQTQGYEQTQIPEQTQEPVQTQASTNSIDDAFEKLKQDLISKYGQAKYGKTTIANKLINWFDYQNLYSIMRYDFDNDGVDEAIAFTINIVSKTDLYLDISGYCFDGKEFNYSDKQQIKLQYYTLNGIDSYEGFYDDALNIFAYIFVINDTPMLCTEFNYEISDSDYWWWDEYNAFTFENGKFKEKIYLYAIEDGAAGYSFELIKNGGKPEMIYKNDFWEEIISGKYKNSKDPVHDALVDCGYPNDSQRTSNDFTTFFNSSSAKKILHINAVNYAPDRNNKTYIDIHDYTGLEK